MDFKQVILLKDPDEFKIDEITQQSSKVSVIESMQGWIAIAGDFPASLLQRYEHYSAESDWESQVGWKDKLL